MAWATGADAARLHALADAFAQASGRPVSLTLFADMASYRQDLLEAMGGGTPPDVCLVSARDFNGLDAKHDLAPIPAPEGSAMRSVAALTVAGHIRAAPDEFSVNVLFYNPQHFDLAGIGYPDRHWNWDILEADTRALDSLHLKDAHGQPIYPLELAADFDLYDILCLQAGHPALDLDQWHVGDGEAREAQLRALGFIHELFQGLTVTAPLPKPTDPPAHFFASQRASLLIAPSDVVASLPSFPYAFTLLPRDVAAGSLARVNGWAVLAKSADPKAATALATYLASQPVHAGWTSTVQPADDGSPTALLHEALDQALVPRLDPRSARFVAYLDQQIHDLAHEPKVTGDELYAQIQTAYVGNAGPLAPSARPKAQPGPKPKAEAGVQLRGM
jgi:ABC-type glycerol-3-phosphate transport system substrate-binding protein